MLFDGVTLVPDHLQGDLFLVSAYTPTIERGYFPKIYLYQANAVEGVQTASPLYIELSDWLNPQDLSISETEDFEFELFPTKVKSLAFTLMDNQRVYVAGLFSLGSTLFDYGHVVLSDWIYEQWYGQNVLDFVSVGCLTLEPTANIEQVRSQLQTVLPKSIRVLTQTELAESEQAFRASLPNGKVLNFGAIMGFIVGVVIVYQVLYTDVSDHLSEYATLKAMGYSDRILIGVVLQEAIVLAVLGFIPGYFASYGVYQLLVQITRVPLTMKAAVAIQVFVLTLVMCGVSGVIAINKLRSADPAEVF